MEIKFPDQEIVVAEPDVIVAHVTYVSREAWDNDQYMNTLASYESDKIEQARINEYRGEKYGWRHWL